MDNRLLQMEIDEIEGIDLEHRFQIENKEQLNWALRKLSALKQEQAEIDQLADREMERIMEWREKETDAVNNSKAYFEGAILEYAMNQRKLDPNFKNVSTPFGKVAFRKQQPKWNYDDQKLVSFLNENELYDFVGVKEEPMKAEIKKHFKVKDGRVYDENGQQVEGITVEIPEDKLEIKAE
jgi:hypothetical protein